MEIIVIFGLYLRIYAVRKFWRNMLIVWASKIVIDWFTYIQIECIEYIIDVKNTWNEILYWNLPYEILWCNRSVRALEPVTLFYFFTNEKSYVSRVLLLINMIITLNNKNIITIITINVALTPLVIETHQGNIWILIRDCRPKAVRIDDGDNSSRSAVSNLFWLTRSMVKKSPEQSSAIQGHPPDSTIMTLYSFSLTRAIFLSKCIEV